MYVAGIDIGTTTICAVVADALSGRVITAITAPNDTGVRSPEPWAALQDAGRIYNLALEMLERLERELHSRHGELAAIGVTGQMHGILYVDDSGEPLGPLATWQDRRGEQPLADGETYASLLARLTGYPVATGYGMVTHYYNQLNDLVPKRAAKLCTIGDFVAMKLGERGQPNIEPTNADALGLFAQRRMVFDVAALAAAGIDPDMMPEIAVSGVVAGHRQGRVPIAAAIGDNQASFLGAVPALRHSALVNVGTGSQISVYVDSWVADALSPGQGLEARPFMDGGRLLVGASLGGGKSYALLERLFREVCRVFGEKEPESGLYAVMNKLAGEALDGEIPLFAVEPLFYGSREQPQATASIMGITPSNWSVSHLAAGFLVGMAEELRAFYERLPDDVRGGMKMLIGSGNGIRANPALRSAIKRTFGMPLGVPPHPEEAALGAAIHAAVAASLFASHDEAVGVFRSGGEQDGT